MTEHLQINNTLKQDFMELQMLNKLVLVYRQLTVK